MSGYILPDGPESVKRPAPTPLSGHERAGVAWAYQHERAEVRRLSCATMRQQADDLAGLPRPIRADAWRWLAAIAIEAADRAEHGCGICGSLIERPDGGCRRAAS